MQMVVVTVVPTGSHRVSAYAMWSEGGSFLHLFYKVKLFACQVIVPHLESCLVYIMLEMRQICISI